ncbi:MAG TPA: class I SAM-dependent methyltransferase [Cellvibrio sp.]|nr:class I SAM-dependent methyltransferase [Cellvibrio sp.]
MPSSSIYTDLSCYYDLMCADINYSEQCEYVKRLHQLFGNKGTDYLDLACGTGPHIRHFINYGYSASGVDINQPMLDIAQRRCPEGKFIQQDMSLLELDSQFDLITCFLYSIHYNQTIAQLNQCISAVHRALKPGGMVCFNAVDKQMIDNRPGIKRRMEHDKSIFCFQSNWYYPGEGDQQKLQLSIEKTTAGKGEFWQDEHSMVAFTFAQMQNLLAPYFEVHVFEHDYQKITPWNNRSGNAFFVGIK